MPLTFSGGGSFAVHIGDHLRFGIICGPVWGSFAVGDHLRRCTAESVVEKYGACIKPRAFRYTSSWLPSDWLLLTVYVNILSVCLKQSEA